MILIQTSFFGFDMQLNLFEVLLPVDFYIGRHKTLALAHLDLCLLVSQQN